MQTSCVRCKWLRMAIWQAGVPNKHAVLMSSSKYPGRLFEKTVILWELCQRSCALSMLVL